jgi:hypothetical protein
MQKNIGRMIREVISPLVTAQASLRDCPERRERDCFKGPLKQVRPTSRKSQYTDTEEKPLGRVSFGEPCLDESWGSITRKRSSRTTTAGSADDGQRRKAPDHENKSPLLSVECGSRRRRRGGGLVRCGGGHGSVDEDHRVRHGRGRQDVMAYAFRCAALALSVGRRRAAADTALPGRRGVPRRNTPVRGTAGREAAGVGRFRVACRL